MEEPTERKTKPRRWMRSLVKLAFANKKATLLIAAAFLVGLYVLFHNKGVVARLKLEAQRREMEQRITAAEQENARLRVQIKALEGDKKMIEKVAREKYGMARDGETVYRVKKN